MTRQMNRKNYSKANSKNKSKPNKSWGAKVHTFRSIDENSISTTAGASSSSSSATGNAGAAKVASNSEFQIQHIPDLSSSEYAASILQRIQKEFTTIVQRRGYSVTSVTEMCCCDDGYNYMETTTRHAKNNRNGGSTKRRRNIRTMPNNVLGYNLTQGTRYNNNSNSNDKRKKYSSIHRIHLRLRHPNNHSSFYSYEDIAGTMCHELAHCEYGRHDKNFYKCMDDIMEQYSLYLVRGVVLDTSGFPLNSQNSYILGGGGGSGNTNSVNGNLLAHAAQRRFEQRQRYGSGAYVLGGGLSYIQEIKRKENEQRTNGFNIYGNSSSSSSSSSSTLAKLPPREAARIAAERRVEERRTNDSKYCLPCQEIIEILDGDSSSSDNNDDDHNDDDDIIHIVNVVKREKNGKCSNDSNGEKDLAKYVQNKKISNDKENTNNSNRKHKNDNSKNKNEKKQETTRRQKYKSNDRINTSSRKGEKDNVKSRDREIIDLIEVSSDNDDDDNDDIGKYQHANSFQGEMKDDTSWNCTRCTFVNESITRVCKMCGDAKPQKRKNQHHQDTNQKCNHNIMSQSATTTTTTTANDMNEISKKSVFDDKDWKCSKCTFSGNQSISLSCEVCGIERSENNNQKVIEKILRDDFIENVKKNRKGTITTRL